MNCRKAKLNLSAYIDGELEAAEEKALAAHVANCDSCRTELANLRVAVAMVKSLPRLKAPAVLKERVLADAQSRRFSYRLSTVLALVTAAALLLVGVVTVFMFDTHEPPCVTSGKVSAMRDNKTREVALGKGVPAHDIPVQNKSSGEREAAISPAEGMIKARCSAVEEPGIPAPQATPPKLAGKLPPLKKQGSNTKREDCLLRTGNVAATTGKVNKLLETYSIANAKEASDLENFGNTAAANNLPAGEVVVLLVEVDNRQYRELVDKLKKLTTVKDEMKEENAHRKSSEKESSKGASRAIGKADKAISPGHGEGSWRGGAGTGRQSPDTVKPFSEPASRQGRGNIPEKCEEKKDTKPQREDVKQTRKDGRNKRSKKKALKLADSSQAVRETVILRIIVIDANLSQDRLLEILRVAEPRKSGSDK